MELRCEMTPIEVDRACSCGIGRMRPTGTVLTMSPPLYPHACNRCGKGENYEVQYPYMEYRPSDS
jgi:hypothetical protein